MEDDVEMKEEDDSSSSSPSLLPKQGCPLPRELMFRELGLNKYPCTSSSQQFQQGPGSSRVRRGLNIIGSKVVSDNLEIAADYSMIMSNKNLGTKSKFQLPQGARTTFHIAFSGDGKYVASCHGDHNVYVCEIKSGKVIRSLSGHPRTPWCVVFHPTQSDVLASGCLAGHVRVWDLKGGSELLVTDTMTVIASLAFHPSVRLLAIGTSNEIIFWDWSKGNAPLARCATESPKEKMRLVRFDVTGRYLITGITNFPTAPILYPLPNPLQSSQNPRASAAASLNVLRGLGVGLTDLDPDIQEELEERQDRFQESYRQLVSHYEDLVQHYHTFLRNRVPRILGTDSPPPESRPFVLNPRLRTEIPPPPPPRIRSSSTSTTGIAGSAQDPPLNPTDITTDVQPDEDDDDDDDNGDDNEPRPGPSSSSRLSTSSLSSGRAPSPTLSTTGGTEPVPGTSTGGGSSSAATPREFGSIEALAQNIMEMQNLCSQARQRVHLGSPSMETQHVVELQQIRQHLEVLQDQTRRLQHSIRATLTSLATGSSLAALRTQSPEGGAGGNGSGVTTGGGGGPLVIPSTTSGSGTGSFSRSRITPSSPSMSSTSSIVMNAVNYILGELRNEGTSSSSSSNSSSSASSPDSNPTALTNNPSNPEVPPIPPILPSHRPRRSISPSTSNPTSFFRISINTNRDRDSRAYSPPPTGPPPPPLPVTDRMRVPPGVRFQESSNSGASTSGGGGSTSNGRRVVYDHHARNCPFNLNSSGIGPSSGPLPPHSSTRTRCLIEESDQGAVELEAWPTYETGMNTRSFPGVEGNSRGNNSRSSPLPGPSGSSSSPDVNLRVFLTVRAGGSTISAAEADVELSENWQRNFLSGLALVPSAVREGRRGRNVLRIRRNYVRAQAPQRLNDSFVRSFYIRMENELIPVYSSHEQSSSSSSAAVAAGSSSSSASSQGHEIRDSLGSNVFVYPLSVFFPDSDSAQQIGIYWPCQSQGEEEGLSDVRRFETPITVYPNPGPRGRVRISYDANSLDIEVGGVRMGVVQPGVQILEAITTLRGGGGTRGVVYVDYLAPLLEGMERYFLTHVRGGLRRRHHHPPRRIITFARERELGNSGASGGGRSSPSSFNRIHSQFHEGPISLHGPGDDSNGNGSSDSSSRRVLSLAVETAASAASELLINRRPVESRIERVLNNSSALNGNNNGGPTGMPSASSLPSTSTTNTPSSAASTILSERLDEIQRRIHLLSSRHGGGNGGGGAPRNSGERSASFRTSPTVTSSSGPPPPFPPHSHHHWILRRHRRLTSQIMRTAVAAMEGSSARTRITNAPGNGGRNSNNNNNSGGNNDDSEGPGGGGGGSYSRFGQSMSPEILITPRATLNGSPGSSLGGGGGPGPSFSDRGVHPPTSSSWTYHIDTGPTTSFLSSRVQRWDFSQFVIPDISQRYTNIVVRECSLHSDACLDISRNSDFLAVLQPSDSGAYSALGLYSLKDSNLGDLLHVYHFDQNTVSVSISASSAFVSVGYAGRGPMYRFVQQGNNTGRNIGQILSIPGKTGGTLYPVRDVYTEHSGIVMAINCLGFIPVPGMGIVFGTNTGELILLQ